MALKNRESIRRVVSAALDAAGWGAQQAVADAAGVSPQTVSKWKSGETAPTEAHWPSIEQTLRLPSGMIAAAAEEPSMPSADVPGGEGDDPYGRIVAAVRAHPLLDAGGQAIMIDVLDGLLRRAVEAAGGQVDRDKHHLA